MTAQKEQAPLQQLATCLVSMFGGTQTYEEGHRLMIEQHQYIPGHFTLDDKEVQAKWDKAYRAKMKKLHSEG